MVPQKSNFCLELRDISIRLAGVDVLKDINIRVREQEIVSIIGPNGAGKTTLFDIVCGNARPTSGRVYHGNRDITGWPPHRICHAGIARTFQTTRPFPEMTARENVQMGLWFGKKGARASSTLGLDSDGLLELVGLGRKRDTRGRDLTLSEQRRLEVARALGTRPRLLLLDEIAAGLSPQAIKQAVELVKMLRERGLTLIIVDHFLNLTARVSDRLIALDQGEQIAEGEPDEVLNCSEVVASYLGERQKTGQEESADGT
jgi:branched-chain amino acid transport system ATP-binding protein